MEQIVSAHSLVDSTEISDDALAEIGLILEMRRNFSMSVYKDRCMKRRIAIRMRSCCCSDAAEYCNLLRQSDHELDLLKKNLTIHVSQFFRNPSMFEKLQNSVIPYLLQSAAAWENRLKFWSLGCAAGEEAYSLGIILQEHFAGDMLETPVEIHGFDVDPGILQAAEQAVYNQDRLNDLPEQLKEKYFVPKGVNVQLCEHIRSMVKFHQRNIVDVEAFEPCHLVLCRNTLIYFTRPDQEKILRGIARILPSGGILVLGKSETLVGEVRGFFKALCPVERIYRRL